MKYTIKYDFSGEMWKSDGQGGWHFVSLPKELSKEIRDNLQWHEEGWGRMKVMALIKGKKWQTAIWFDKKRNTYLLPVKSEVRKASHLTLNEQLHVTIFI